MLPARLPSVIDVDRRELGRLSLRVVAAKILHRAGFEVFATFRVVLGEDGGGRLSGARKVPVLADEDLVDLLQRNPLRQR